MVNSCLNRSTETKDIAKNRSGPVGEKAVFRITVYRLHAVSFYGTLGYCRKTFEYFNRDLYTGQE